MGILPEDNPPTTKGATDNHYKLNKKKNNRNPKQIPGTTLATPKHIGPVRVEQKLSGSVLQVRQWFPVWVRETQPVYPVALDIGRRASSVCRGGFYLPFALPALASDTERGEG